MFSLPVQFGFRFQMFMVSINMTFVLNCRYLSNSSRMGKQQDLSVLLIPLVNIGKEETNRALGINFKFIPGMK